jgi:class 3 adenylate cyclase
MRQSTEQRRLLAVVVADIVSYSRLMAENEADTFYRLKDFQTSLITPALERNHGHVVKWTGDGFLATFDSAVDAVRAAVEIQSGAASAGASADDNRRIRFRIGINSGDVIVVPGDVYGDTVNVAARLEALAVPGGICISRGVRDTVRGKFSVDFEDRGELAVKNIPDPVGAFNVRFDPIAWTMSRDTAPSRAPSRVPLGIRPRYLGGAAIALVVAAIAIGSTWYFLAGPASDPARIEAVRQPSAPVATANLGPAPSRAELIARSAAVAPSLPAKAREEMASGYENSRAHRAQAVSVEPAGHWRAADRPTAENAEESALENCQLFYGQPCVLLAVDGIVQPNPPGDSWPRRDMARVGYAGTFDPERIPGVAPGIREREDIVKYRSAPSPKAVAMTPRGDRVFTIVGAASQHAAEQEVLGACNAEPGRGRLSTTCFLYAAADRVVLALRLTAPLTAATTTAVSAPPAGATTTAVSVPPAATVPPVPLRDALAARLEAVAPALPAKLREDAARTYGTARGHKAQAASPQPAGIWRAADRPTADNAEESALENCQIVFGQPCALLAINDAVQPVPADGNWPRRDMPRARYAGSFDPAQIPGALPPTRERADIVAYRSASGAKAVAFTPVAGRAFAITGAANQRTAEEEALKACDADPARKAENGACFLYAVGDDVILPRRLKQPLSAAPNR